MLGCILPSALLLPCVLAGSLPVKLHVKRAVDSRLANVHVDYDEPIYSEIGFTYGPCQAKTPGEAHPFIGCSKTCDHDRL